MCMRSGTDVLTDSQNVLRIDFLPPPKRVARAQSVWPSVERRTLFAVERNCSSYEQHHLLERGSDKQTVISKEDYQLHITYGVCLVETIQVYSGGGILANMATCYSSYEIQQQPTSRTPQLQKDYTRPLHVDCSVEYELPNQAKPPVGVRNEPLLMIHPCYFRKIESQRRSPFTYVNPTKRDPMLTAAYSSSTGSTDSGHWTDSDKSPEKTEEKHILSGKYRQYLRAHRLHPYVTSSIPLASTFPQIQQVCYNV
ncbi:corto [Carabus blaptoides fortunei]